MMAVSLHTVLISLMTLSAVVLVYLIMTKRRIRGRAIWANLLATIFVMALFMMIAKAFQ